MVLKQTIFNSHTRGITAVIAFLVLYLLTVTGSALAASAWKNVGDPGFSADGAYSTSLALDAGGTPYVAFGDDANDVKATVMRFNGTSWETVGAAGFSAGYVSGTSLALHASGTPYVAFGDGANGYKATVMRFNGTSWEAVGSAGFSAGGANFTSLALDAGGTPYVAFRDGANGDKATVMRFKDGSWETVGFAGFSAGNVIFTSLALDAGGTPYVAFRDGAKSGKATVMGFQDSLTPIVSRSSPSNGASIQPISKLNVSFNKEMRQDGSAGAANNTANYLLLEAGGDSFQTLNCSGGAHADDQVIPVNSAIYSSSPGGPFKSTLTVNNGSPLPTGSYRLLVCGTTSVEDLNGIKLNDGLSDSVINFTIKKVSEASPTLPQTGFAPGRFTSLPTPPLDSSYTHLETLWLEIPILGIKAPIVGVPATAEGWDVTWLGGQVGWLEGTAFPTWAGNSILTAHVYDANGQPGLFAGLHRLERGNRVLVKAWGQIYTFEVHAVEQYLSPNDSGVVSHEKQPWITLLTCQGYNPVSDSYRWRVAARAVLMRVD